jgi:hypothetical protein
MGYFFVRWKRDVCIWHMVSFRRSFMDHALKMLLFLCLHPLSTQPFHTRSFSLSLTLFRKYVYSITLFIYLFIYLFMVYLTTLLVAEAHVASNGSIISE